MNLATPQTGSFAKIAHRAISLRSALFVLLFLNQKKEAAYLRQPL
jgi:hypothetical protein